MRLAAPGRELARVTRPPPLRGCSGADLTPAFPGLIPTKPVSSRGRLILGSTHDRILEFSLEGSNGKRSRNGIRIGLSGRCWLIDAASLGPEPLVTVPGPKTDPKSTKLKSRFVVSLLETHSVNIGVGLGKSMQGAWGNPCSRPCEGPARGMSGGSMLRTSVLYFNFHRAYEVLVQVGL